MSTLVTGAYVLVVDPAVPASTVQALIELARAQPLELNFSSFGEGSSSRLVTEWFKRMAAGARVEG